MSDDSCFVAADVLNGSLCVDDETLDDEYEEHLRAERQAVEEAMHEALQEFSPFEDSSCEDDDTSCEDDDTSCEGDVISCSEDVQENCNSVKQPERIQTDHRLNSTTPTSSPSVKTQVRSHSIPEGLNRSGILMQHQGALTNGEYLQLRAEAHYLSASVDNLMHVGAEPDRLSCPSSFQPLADISKSYDHCQFVNYAIDSPDQRHLNQVKVQTDFHHQLGQYNHNCKGPGDNADIRSKNVDWNLESVDNKRIIHVTDNQPWTNNVRDESGQSSSVSNRVTAGGPSQEFKTANSNNFLPCQNGYHFKSEIADVKSRNETHDDDEWMMHINKPIKAYTQASHQHPRNQFNYHHHHHLHQSGDYRQDSKSNQNLLVQSLPAHLSTSLVSTKVLPPSAETPLMSAASPSRKVATSANRDVQNVQQMLRNAEVHDGGDGQFGQYKVHYEKPGLCKLEEEQFYLDNENVEFLHMNGPEDHQTYRQLEILYRARGREIEELTQKMKEKDEEKNKEIRNLKHRLTIASGDAEAMNESLRQCQQLLQQAKSDNSEANGKIRALEMQVLSYHDTKEELIQKLQIAESTIENLTHHIEELQASESLSRARNEHEAVVAGLASRHERELLIVREKLDSCKTSLEAKQEELAHVKKQLADTAHELEQTQVSKAETVNRLNRSLEESQRQCQVILEQSSPHEASMMKIQLQQAMTSKRSSEDLCQTFQREIKELKEQLNMFESASQLGVFASSHSSNIPSHDDSMTDLGIRKTLTFDSPQSIQRCEETPASDKLIASLKSELEKCLYSNRQKRSEVIEKIEEVKVLKEELEETHSRAASLEKTCAEQKSRLQEFDSLNKPGDGGVTAVEARLRREIEDLKRDMNALLADIEDYKTRLQEIGDSEAKLTEINAELNHQIAQMVNDFDLDKQSALQSCQRTMEAVNKHSFDKLRREIEERFQSEKAMLMDDSKRKLDNLNQALRSTQAELDDVKALYIKTCEDNSRRETALKESHRIQLEEEVCKITDKLEKEKKDWESFMRAQMEKERDQIKSTMRQAVESELKETSHRNIELMVSEARLACIEEQRLVRQTMIEEALADARKVWQTEHERDIQQWAEERNAYESKLSSKSDELCECKQKLDQAVSEKEQFKKHAEDLELDHQTNLMSLEKKHKEEMNDVMVKYDRQILQVEEKLVEICKQFSTSLGNKSGLVENFPLSFQDLDVLGKLHFLENIISGKDARLQELEKMLQEQNTDFLSECSKNGSKLNYLDGRFLDCECYFGDLSEASSEKLKEHIKQLESVLHTIKQKCNREVNELKQQHQKEFENAMRLQEDKFQAELRHFLNEKDDLCKTRIETAIKQCESKVKLQQEQTLKEADEKHKCLMCETICEYENKIAELQKMIDQYEKRLNRELNPSKSTSADDMFSLRGKMKREIFLLEEKYITEKSSLERKLKQLAEDKDDEIVNLCLRQAEEERQLKEKFDNDLASLKVEHGSEIKQLERELSLWKSDADKAHEIIESLKTEIESNKLVVERLRNEIEQTKVSLTNTQSLTEQIKEQRAKWFQEAQEYINDEIQQGIDDQIKKEEGKMRETLEKISEEEGKMREKLKKINEEEGNVRDIQEKIKVEEGKVREKLEMIKEDEGRMQKKLEKINEEEMKIREKWVKVQEDEDMIIKKLEMIKEKEERMKKEQENITEWEKNKETFEREKTQEVRKVVQVEIDNLSKKFSVELNAKVERIKSQLEQQKVAWQEEERKKLLEEREKFIKTLHSDRERSLQEAKNKIKMKIEKVKENQLSEMRNEMQGEMRKRIESVREEWEQEREDHENRIQEELKRLKEYLQAEVDARLTACQERDEAVDHMKYQEKLFREEEQKLMSVLKKCQEDKEEASKRHEPMVEQVTNFNRKCQMNVRKPNAKSNQMPYAAPRNIDRLKSLDQELDTADYGHDDSWSHINVRTPMQAPVIGKEIIDIFNVKAKTNIRSSLSQQVPENLITALEHSLDLLSEHLKTITAKGAHSDSASSRPGSSKHNSCRQQLDDGDVVVIGSKQMSCQECSDAYINNMAVFDKHLQQYHRSHHTQNNHDDLLQEERSHPQLDKVDLFDSDWHQQSASSSNNSTPGSHTCARSHVKPVTRKQQTTESKMQKCSPNETAKLRTTPTKIEASYNDEFSGLPSARDERKCVEARARLENWTQTGEMSWKSARKSSDILLHDADGFINPGFDAEKWAGKQKNNVHLLITQSDNSHVLASQGDNSHALASVGNNSYFLTNSSRHTNVIKQEQHYYNHDQVPSDSSSECSVSSNDSTSFITLQSNMDPIAARTHFNSLKFSKFNNTASEHKDDHLCAEGQIFKEKTTQTLNSNNHDIGFGSQMSVCHVRNEDALVQNVSPGYIQRCLTPPATSLLAKVKVTDGMRSRSEADNIGIQWKTFGGPLVCDFPKDLAINRAHHEPKQSSRSQLRSQSSQRNSHRKANSRSRSAERVDGDLVMKSTEFSSDTCKINQETEQTNLWRYKSLEELIPSLNEQNLEIKNVKSDKRSVTERKNMFADYDHVPVAATTSKFWEQQCVDLVKPKGHHDHKQFVVRQPGYSQFDSETKHKKGTDKFDSQMFNRNSSPARHKISEQKKQQLPGSKMNVEFNAANQTECDLHTQSCFRRRSRCTGDLASVRHSLEEEQLSQYYQQGSPHEDARKAKMTRTLSEQSLHTIQCDKGNSQGQDHDHGSHIDDLLSTYTSTYFGLRPFLYDEHF